MNPLQDAFISYGRADSKMFAKTLHDRLADLGYTVWFDFNDIPLGVDYQKQIDDGIEKADNFLYLISPHSVNSPYCGLEVELALKRNKRIIPLLHVEEISYDTWKQRNPDGTQEQWAEYREGGKHSSFPNMHPAIGKINWVYFREGQDDFEQSLQGLLDLIKRDKDYVYQHTVLLNHALEWEGNQKQTRYLLTGEARQEAEAWMAIRFKDRQPPVVPTDLHYEYITESIKNGENLMTQVFLSHAEEDAEMTTKVRRTLMREGITTWTYQADIEFGSDFTAAIARGVEEADNILFLMSPHSLQSEYCQQELELAIKHNKRLLVMQVAETDVNQIPMFLRNVQYIDLTDNQTDEDYAKDANNLLRQIKQEATYYNEHKVLLTKALKWERQQRNPCILLQGYELQRALAWRELAQTKGVHSSTELQDEFIETSKKQTAAVSPDVFISYSRADSDFARKLNDALQRQRKRTWFDQESIASGSDFQEEINKGIETSNIFLFVLSPRSIKSPYCAEEVEYAANLNKRAVTVLHRPVNAADLHPDLAKVQWIDFNANAGEFDANFQELLRTLDTDPGHLKSHTQLLVKALEWDEKGRRKDVLLRGEDLSEAEQWMVKAIEKEPSPTTLQGEYVSASQQQEEEQAQKEIKQTKRFNIFLSALAFLLAGALVFSLTQLKQAKIAEAKAHIANSKTNARSGKSLTAILDALQAGSILTQHPMLQVLPPTDARNALTEQLQALLTQPPEVNRAENDSFINTLLVHANLESDPGNQPTKEMFFAGDLDGNLRVWHKDGTLCEEEGCHHTLDGSVNSLSMSRDRTTLVAAHSEGLHFFKVNTSDEGATLSSCGDLLSIRDRVNQALFSPDDQYMAVAIASATSGDDATDNETNENTVLLYPWTLDNPSCEQIDPVLPSEAWQLPAVNDMAFAPDGGVLAIATENRIERWDLATSRFLPLTIESSDDIALTSIQFSPTLPVLVSGNKEGRVHVWPAVDNSEETRAILSKCRSDVHIGDVQRMHFHPNGHILATAGIDNTIKLWELSYDGPSQVTGICDLSADLIGHDSAVESVGFSADGTYLISGSEDKTIRKWWLGDFLASQTAPEETETLDLSSLLTRSCNQVNDFLNHNPDDAGQYTIDCAD